MMRLISVLLSLLVAGLVAGTSDLTKELRARHVPGAIYASPEIYRREMVEYFGREWLFVGREEQFAAPGDFDGETLRPYNVRPAALLLNFRSVLYTFVPDAAAGVARVLMEPTLARAQPERTVPLAAGACRRPHR